MLTSSVFRHAKPSSYTLVTQVKGLIVPVANTNFTNQITRVPLNRATFDVIDSTGRILSRELGFEPEYWFEGGLLKCREPGSYTLRVFDNITMFDDVIINVNSGITMSDGFSYFKAGIPFWPEVLTQPNFGVARVSNCGRHLAFASQGETGSVSFGYRLRNAYGQVSEPSCANITVVR